MDRRNFLARMGQVAAFSSMAIVVAACGEDETVAPTPSTSIDGNVSNVAGHTHTVEVTQAQLNAGGTLFLTMQGGGDHIHSVELNPTQVSQLAGGSSVTVTSENGGNPGHSHSVTFTP